MTVRIVKNKRLKMSPGGLITLPVSARKALGMSKKTPACVSVTIDGQEILVTTEQQQSAQTRRISAAGMMELGGEPKALLASGLKRHYWLKLDDDKRQVRLVPYSS